MINFLKKYRTKIILSLFATVALGALFSMDSSMTAHAADNLFASDKIAGTVTTMMSVQNVLNRLLWPILVLIGSLLDNSILFGSGMEERMREIWIPIRNLVNILFVVVLVGIALYSVTGLGDGNGNYSIKQALPKIILAIVLINFSFLGIKVFLDAVNVITASILALPDQVSEGMAEVDILKDPDATKRYCLAIGGKKPGDIEWVNESAMIDYQKLIISKEAAMQFDIKGTTQIEIDTNAANAPLKAEYENRTEELTRGQMCSGWVLTDYGKSFLGQYGGNNAALVLALNMGKIIYYQDIEVTAESAEKMLTSIMFSVLLYLVFAISFVALFIVLIARLVVLWLVIVLSPVLAVVLAVPSLSEQLKGFGDIKDKFVKHAVAPIGISLALTIGWIMLKSMQNIDSIGSDITNAGSFKTIGSGIPIVGLTTMQDFLVGVGTIAVVWLGVFSAASETVAGVLTDRIKSGVQGFGTWIAKRPLDMTIIPIRLPGENQNKEAEKYSFSQVGNAFNRVANSASADADKLSKAMGMEARATDALSKAKNKKEFAQLLASYTGSNAELKDFFSQQSTKDSQIYKDFINSNRDIQSLINKLVAGNATDTEISDLKTKAATISQKN